MTGGIAPTTAPTHVLISCLGFSSVYGTAYRKMLLNPIAVVSGSVHIASNAVPAAPVHVAKPAAWFAVTCPAGSLRASERVSECLG